MPLHLRELEKHTAQNEQIIALLTKLTETQQPKKEVVSNKPQSGRKQNESRQSRPTSNGPIGKNSNK